MTAGPRRFDASLRWLLLPAALVSTWQSLPAQTPANRAPARQEETAWVEVSQCHIRFLDEVTLSGERSGVLDFVAAEGAALESGELAAHLRDDIIRATLEVGERQANNDVEVRYAQKASELSQLEYIRGLRANQELPGTYSDLNLRELKLSAEKSLLQLEQAETALAIEKLKLKETRELLQTYRLEAPFAGIVRKAHKKRGEAVREGEAIVEIASTQRVQVEGYLPIAELDRVRIGSIVEVRLELTEADLAIERQTFPGRIGFVDVKVEPVSNRVRIWAEVANRDNVLKDGLTATLRIDPTRVDAAFVQSLARKRAMERTATGGKPNSPPQ